MHLFERPFTEKVNIGDDPINNKVYGLDLTYSKEAPWVTRLVDKLPVISTKAPSMLNFQAEVAALKPGHARAINGGRKEKSGIVYIDDFEGTASEFDLRTPETRWGLASVPQNAIFESLGERFPESHLHDSLTSGYNRAHLNWYRVDRSVRTSSEDNNNPYTRAVNQQEIFRGRTPRFGNNDFRTLDLNYIPYERGQYNFDPPQGSPFSAGMNANCVLNDPESRWGGIQRDLPNTDFELSNFEFVEFWMLDPYLLPDQYGSDGYLVINLGNISEDVLKDGRMSFEHGLPGAGETGQTDTTRWGRVAKIQPVVNAFSIDVDTRIAQDVGLDGFNDDAERLFYTQYLNDVQNSALSQDCKLRILEDPSNDNFVYFRDPVYDAENAGLLRRYERFNGTENNSPPTPRDNNFITANTNRPNSEDLNDDLSLSDGDEAYYQYVIKMQRVNGETVFTSIGKDGELNNWQLDTITSQNRTWYRFKIPVDAGKAVNGIQGFRSIRFMRMYMTGFEQQTIYALRHWILYAVSGEGICARVSASAPRNLLKSMR
jgi:cell surface protein SprA